ncbi:peroxiredoxin [Clostridium sp. MSJ-4]|uniref:thioredoxin-dependent peroxiredoxin n=1 Tax=Clostridium simiarum TaxID=2841506 RepID=A0ABS6F1M8_9CLOT|nr:peroxiredoxin [Clostridium simiarum]MBU5592422.1 peroxiredoxin [Clostridium simiarum]
MIETTVKVGELAPDFELIGSDEKKHSLKEYEGKNIVLFFYPKDNTPGCTIEAGDFRDKVEAFKDLNTVILGISRDSLKSHDKFITKLSLSYVLLSDESEEVCNLYGVLKDKNMFGKKVKGIERSTFIIDKNGLLIKEYRKVKVNGHADEVEEFLKTINK